MLCPVRALKLYVNRSSHWRKSSQLLVCFGACHRGLAASKHIISHWVREAILLAYEVRGFSSPLSVWAHSTWSVVASSQALFRGVPLEDICVAAGWSSPHILSGFIIWILTRLLVPGSCPLEPAMDAIWLIIGPDMAALNLACLVYHSHCVIATQRRVNL